MDTNERTHAATATRTSKMVWTVTCTCGQTYKIRQQGSHDSVEASALASAEAINTGRFECAS